MRPLRRLMLDALAGRRPDAPDRQMDERIGLLAAAAHLRYGDRNLPVPPPLALETRSAVADWLEKCAHWRAGGDR